MLANAPERSSEKKPSGNTWAMVGSRWKVGLEQRSKGFGTQAGHANDCAKGSAIQLFVIRHNELGKGIVSPQYDVTAFLPLDAETHLRKRADAFSPRNSRQVAHTATTRVSNRSLGMGR